MKKLTILLTVVALGLGTAAFVATDTATDPVGTDNFLTYLDGNKDYTIALAEAMPADKYTFRAVDSVRSFGEQLAHIGQSSQFLLDLFVNGNPMPTQEQFEEAAKMEKKIGADKEACIKLLNDSFDALANAYKGMSNEEKAETFKVPFDPNSPDFPKTRAFDFIRDHMIHHRGQALVALRMQGIKAPQYRLY